ncbi:MAG: CPBP family intramembrane metalloprotease [Eubacteriaceae bacterium]|nr:CPBP family intramembrane metalloprotease [Eubacteriaceae bacterium]
MKLESVEAVLIQTLAITLAFIVGLFFGKKLLGSYKALGLKRPVIGKVKDFLYFIPLFLVELIPLYFGFEPELSLGLVLSLVMLTLVIGFAEELYFRGIIGKLLESKGLVLAVFLSSFLFSIGHFANLLGGKEMLVTLLQVIFAFSFGLVAIALRFATDSILIPILWHVVHNFIAMSTIGNDQSGAIVAGALQFSILVVYMVYLWLKFFRGRIDLSKGEETKSR